MSASIQNREAMFSLIEQWQQSDESQKDFCLQRGLKTHIFYYWYKQYRIHHSSAEGQSAEKFIEIRTDSTSPTGAAIELLLANGNRFIFHQPVSASFIKALIS